ncbi:MAG: hypothetical protein ABIB71_05340 [Candidatus Woesearchaeota archaeon]
MNEDLCDVILETLTEASAAFSAMDSRKLKGVSDYTLHYAGIFQDPDSVNMAIIIYSLAKIVERRKMYKHIKWESFSKKILKKIEGARNALEKENFVTYSNHIKNLMMLMGKAESKFGEYVTEVINQAKIKKGSKVFEHGISVGRAAEIMGISPWELMEYVGHTRIMDKTPMLSMTAKKRLQEARRIFNLE